jgi:hypothetical protein
VLCVLHCSLQSPPGIWSIWIFVCGVRGTNLLIIFMVVHSCKKCGELNYLTPHAFWNITDFGAKCEKCNTINTITLENGELKKTDIVSQKPMT